MQIEDSVYGSVDVTEPVFEALIGSAPVQRLKGVSQFGMPDDYYHRETFSRYDHSIGVFLLLRRLGASLEEQVAGLLHDVSHTAFSHVIDRVLGDPTREDYQDRTHHQFITRSDIPDILSRYGYRFERIADFEYFSLLDQEIPSLCADRVDYSLRELQFGGQDVADFVSALSTHKGEIVFDDMKVASQFTQEFYQLNRWHWAGDQAVVRYEILSDVLKRALDTKVVSHSDLYGTDREVLRVLEGSSDAQITESLSLLREGIVITPVSEGGLFLRKKLRYVDPGVLVDGHVSPLSALSDSYKRIIDRQKNDSILKRRVAYRKVS